MDTKALTPEQSKAFQFRREAQLRSYKRAQTLWGLAYSSTLSVSIVSSAAAAVIPQLQGFSDTTYQKNLTSILAGLAAALISLSTAGGLGKRWRACRLSRSKVRKLNVELIGREATTADIDRLNQIDEEYNEAITST